MNVKLPAKSADIPLSDEGVVYHIAAAASNIADKIILVGDPSRVPLAATYFDPGSLEFDQSHREIRTMTGKYRGQRVTVLSSGMGTDNMEIIMNELHILKEYDVQTSSWTNDKKEISLIRVGTCGSPQDVPIGTLAISRHALGLDNTCQYYAANEAILGKDVARLKAIANQTELGQVGVYAASAHPDITRALKDAAQKHAPNRPSIVGITASASGFFACQGRVVGRFAEHMRFPDLVDILSTIELPIEGEPLPEKVINLEMENSSLCYLAGLLGYKAGTICAIISTRSGPQRAFATPEQSKAALHDALTIGFEALTA
ncbi:MAG: nucleoside phosphorylase [Myxococcota bacterium]